MAELADLERRIGVLEDIEAIKRLKAKYWRSLDTMQPDQLRDCFSENAVLDHGPEEKFHGREEIVRQYKLRLCQAHLIALHQGYGSDIEIIGETTAKAIWGLNFHRINSRANTEVRAWGYYEDDFVKEHGQWRIAVSRFTVRFVERLKKDA